MVKRRSPSTEAPDTGVDWAGMKPHWQAGILSIAELSRRFNVSRAAITKHWAKEKVERNLTEQIRAEAQSLVHKAEAAGTPVPAAVPSPEGVEPTDRETVAFNARMQAGVILRHRRDILAAQELVAGLLLELRTQAVSKDHFQQMQALLLKAGKAGKLNTGELAALKAVYDRASTTGARLSNLKTASETLKTLVELERKVLAIADDTPPDPGTRIGEAVASGLEELQRRFRERGLKV